MRLYHGSNIDIDQIDLEKCRPYKDFGKGFYLTQLQEQAQKMALRVSRIYGREPVVNVYEIEDGFLQNKNLSIRDFGNNPSADWARFVMNNRDRSFKDFGSPDCNLDNKYDIVAGPIANDDMALLFRQYQNELITFEMMLSGLVFREATNQYSFHSEKALCLLRKVGVL